MKVKKFIKITSSGRNEWEESIGYIPEENIYYSSLNSDGERDVRRVDSVAAAFRIFKAGMVIKIAKLCEDHSTGADTWICGGNYVGGELIMCGMSYTNDRKGYVTLMDETFNFYQGAAMPMHVVLIKLQELVNENERMLT